MIHDGIPRTTFKRRDGAGVAVWDAKLTDEECKALASGTHPLLIRPISLIYFVTGPGAIELYRRKFEPTKVQQNKS